MSSWIWAYNTNGLAHHRLDEALRLLADLGYRGVALTLDVGHLDPNDPELLGRCRASRRLLERLGLSVIVESGARFQLDPRRKHYPSLMSSGRERRITFLETCIDAAVELGAPMVSLWSGHDFDAVGPVVAEERLRDGLLRVLDHAGRLGIGVAFEPEPGMFIETVAGFLDLKRRLARPEFGLALDVGHLLAVGEEPVADVIQNVRGDLMTVAIEDMRRGVHEHLEPGSGDLDFRATLQALRDVNYRGMISVELPRHSSRAPETAARAIEFLRAVESGLASK